MSTTLDRKKRTASRRKIPCQWHWSFLKAEVMKERIMAKMQIQIMVSPLGRSGSVQRRGESELLPAPVLVLRLV